MPTKQVPETLWPKLHAMAPGPTLTNFLTLYRNPKTAPGALVAVLEANPAALHLLQRFDLFQKLRSKWEEIAPTPDPGSQPKAGAAAPAAGAAAEAKPAAEAQAAPPAGAAPAAAAKPGAPPAAAAPAKPTAASAVDFMSSVGKVQARNAIASLWMLRGVPDLLPKRAASEFTYTPSKHLRYALACEEVHEVHRYSFPEEAFLGGLHYDWFLQLLTLSKAPKDVLAEFDDAWKQGFRTAQVAHRISTQFRNLPKSEWIFAAALAVPLGKVWMSWIFGQAQPDCPTWKEFLDKIEDVEKLRREAWIYMERRSFPLVHTEMAALSASFFGFLKPVVPAIAACQEPVVLKKARPDLYPFTLVLRAAQILCTTQGLEEVDLNSPRFSKRDRWVFRELKLRAGQLRDVLKDLEGAPK